MKRVCFREYTILKSNGSIASHESNDSGASENSVNGTLFGAVKAPLSKRVITTSQPRSNSAASIEHETKLPVSPTSSGSGNAAGGNRRQKSGFMSRFSTRSNQSGGSNENSPVAPLARPEFDASHEFYYEVCFVFTLQ